MLAQSCFPTQAFSLICLGGWVGGGVVEGVEAVEMRCWSCGLGAWVGGWVIGFLLALPFRFEHPSE